MDAKEALRLIIEESDKSGRQVAREIDRSESFISSSLAQGVCPRADTLARVAHTCGYELAIVTRSEAERISDTGTSIVLEYDARVRGTLPDSSPGHAGTKSMGDRE